MTEELLARIAAALDRIAPPPPADADPLDHPAYVWRDGALQAARAFAPLPLDLLEGVDSQKEALVGNMRRLAAGLPAHDVLLWGARGTGKSALVKAGVGAVQDEGGDLALIEVAGDALTGLPRLFDRIAGQPRAFVLFVDDLGFAEASEAPRLLRSLLEGGAEARPANARLHVTSNRRHIVPRDIKEQDGSINPRDTADDKLALADRFGLSLGFHVVDQPTYLAMLEGYARTYGLALDPHDAIAWAVQRGGRSGRVAWQYVVELAGRQGKRL
ncbi:ATP-binding protein [Sphingomonas nostoxanthinifaciens]|uniref:ATP-binding protein n=1 Tax=Sphingomonas nostoxanthinifaciens TaxID=2872652 RepID=UPI001CC204ED|nr:ATP-binding protein [Sphingomonas nostoxanthinifaciens]UAK23073.1 ATP-binding protein [Sphingomonas nostoxanthinifaciens]